MIIETSANQFYRVEETGEHALDHCWWGTRVYEICKGQWMDKRGARPELVRKTATRVISG